MNSFDFTFQDSYTGFWDIEGVGNHIAGTLFLHDSSIELDLFYEGSINVINEGVNYVKGKAFSKDADGKERAYDFVLYGLCIKKCTGLRNINHYVYDVEYFYLYLLVSDNSLYSVGPTYLLIEISTRYITLLTWYYPMSSICYS